MCRFLMLAFLFFATTTAASAQATDSEQGIALTFLSHRTGYNQIYTSQPDGSKPQAVFGGPITDVPSFNDSYTMFREPHWTRQSPNGRYFASWVYESGKPYSEFQGAFRPMLVVGDIRGSWTRVVNPDCHEEFAWSPDSQQLAFSILSTANYHGTLQDRPETTEICVSGIDGSNFKRVLEIKGKWFVLDWSADAKRLLLIHHSFGKRLEDGTSSLFEFRLTDALLAQNNDQFQPDWNVKRAPEFLDTIDLNLDDTQFSGARYSPTRNELAILTYDPQNMYAPNMVVDDELGRGQMMRLLGKIYVFDLNARNAVKVADYEEGIRGPICWSPGGDEVYFSRYLPKDDDRENFAESKEHGLSIWSVGRDGSNAKFVTTGWSPDFPHAKTQNGK